MAISKPKFLNTANTKFHGELKKRVQDYFKQNNIKPYGNLALHFKAALLWSLYIAGYIHLVFYTPPGWWAVLESLVMGGLTAAIGFNVMHDGGHGSFSENKVLNKIAAYSVNLLGASAIMWSVKHNVIHHTYTNIDGLDDDIEARPFLRMCRTQKRYFLHRFQHVYFWFLYTLLLIAWVFLGDFRKYFTGKIGPLAMPKLSLKEHIGFWAAKLLYFVIMIAIPIYFVGFSNWLIGFAIIAGSAGFILSIVFQLAHTVEETSFPEPVPGTNDMESEWAVHQLYTTANFGTRNKVLSWLVGGLNFQIEHHLFPKISHVHYPAISKIVKQTCAEFQIPYIEHKYMVNAIISHAQHLKRMGTAA